MIKSFHKENGTLYFNEHLQELFLMEGNIYDGLDVIASTEDVLPKSLIRTKFTLTEDQVRSLITEARSVFSDIDEMINNLRAPHTITVEYDGGYKWETIKAEY